MTQRSVSVSRGIFRNPRYAICCDGRPFDRSFVLNALDAVAEIARSLGILHIYARSGNTDVRIPKVFLRVALVGWGVGAG